MSSPLVDFAKGLYRKYESLDKPSKYEADPGMVKEGTESFTKKKASADPKLGGAKHVPAKKSKKKIAAKR